MNRTESEKRLVLKCYRFRNQSLKGLSDVNAPTSPEKLSAPILLMLVGVEERRRQIGTHHPSVGGIFDVVKRR